MNWFLLAVVSVAFVASTANAVQNEAFKERAEIYSSESNFCAYYCTSFTTFASIFIIFEHFEEAQMKLKVIEKSYKNT